MRRLLTCLTSSLFLAACSGGSGPQPICGDDAINQESEQCDRTRLDGKTCADLGFAGGELQCGEDCRFDTSLCTDVLPDCNDGDIDPGEECDGHDLGGASCSTLGFAGGELACTSDCRFDASDCEPFPCGDGSVDAGEQCDGGDLDGWQCADFGFAGGELSCTDDCRLQGTGCSGCSDDAFEPNDDRAGAAALEPGSHELVLCSPGGEEDWFAITLSAGQRLLLELTQGGPEADLDIELLDGSGLVVASSGQPELVEVIDYTSAEGGSHYLRVFVYGDWPGAVSYQLLVVLDPECVEHGECLAPGQVCQDHACVDFICSDSAPCPAGLVCDAGSCVECASAADCPEPDAYLCQQNTCVYSCSEDSFEPNSGKAEAATIAPGALQTGLTLCGDGDEDWFLVDLDELVRYQLTLQFSHAAGDIDVEVFEADDDDVPVAVGYSNDDGELVDFAVASGAAGQYLIRVYQPAGDLAQTYSLGLADQGAVGCAWNGDCTEGEVCLDYACVVPDCTEDADCTAPDRCVANSCVSRPRGDVCDDTIAVTSLPFSDTGVDMAVHRNAIGLAAGACTDWGSGGNDVIYRLDVPAGGYLWVTVDADFDAVVVLLDQCTSSPASCLAGADDTIGPGREQVWWLAGNDTTIYAVIGTPAPLYPQQGSFDITIEVE